MVGGGNFLGFPLEIIQSSVSVCMHVHPQRRLYQICIRIVYVKPLCTHSLEHKFYKAYLLTAFFYHFRDNKTRTEMLTRNILEHIWLSSWIVYKCSKFRMAPFLNSMLCNQNSKSNCLQLRIARGALVFTPTFWIPTKTVILEPTH